MSVFALKYAVIALAVLLVVGGLWWAAKRPTRSRQRPARMRMPLFTALVGWVLLTVGFFMALVSFTSRFTEDLLPMRIASLVLVAAALSLLVAYNNWYVEAGPDEVRFRTVLGRERVIRYAEIIDYRMREVNGKARLKVRSSTGVKLSLNPQIYPVDPLLEAIRFRERAGRWPLVGEHR